MFSGLYNKEAGCKHGINLISFSREITVPLSLVVPEWLSRKYDKA
jgi:hypothetical protein